MNNFNQQIQLLQQKIDQFKQDYIHYHNALINVEFSPTLFHENQEPLAYYIDQLQYSLQQLAQLSADDLAQAEFLSEKFIAQYNALQDAVSQLTAKVPKTAVNLKPVLNKREQLRQQIEQLPPRERLVKYYEALQALTEKLDLQKGLFKLATSSFEKQRLEKEIEITNQRRARCLDAIENLEEFLRFKQEQEDEN